MSPGICARKTCAQQFVKELVQTCGTCVPENIYRVSEIAIIQEIWKDVVGKHTFFCFLSAAVKKLCFAVLMDSALDWCFRNSHQYLLASGLEGSTQVGLQRGFCFSKSLVLLLKSILFSLTGTELHHLRLQIQSAFC